MGVWLGVAPFLLLMVLASFMLSGCEQFTDDQE
jgi:hypothetical protein